MLSSRSVVSALAAAAGLAMIGAANAQFAVVSNQPGTFTDIGGTGTPIILPPTDDGSIAFTSSVTNALVTNPNLYACSNGFISDTFQSTYANYGLPLTGASFGLFPFWDDLYVDTGGSVVHQNLVLNGISTEIIQWNNVRTYEGGTGTATGTFQMKIF